MLLSRVHFTFLTKLDLQEQFLGGLRHVVLDLFGNLLVRAAKVHAVDVLPLLESLICRLG